MAQHDLYFVPISEIIVNPTSDRNSVIRNEDVTYNFDTNGRTITLTPDATFHTISMNDSSNDGVFNDDGNFGNQTLATAAFGLNAGAGLELNYSYTLSGSDGSSITIYSVASNNDGSATQDTIVGFVSDARLQAGVTYTITGRNSLVNPSYSSLLTCFAAGTMIRTVDGETPIEQIALGDLVETRDHGYQPVRWIGGRHIRRVQLDARPNLRPICIAKGALGDGFPAQDLVVSPQHPILVRSKIAQRMFDSAEVLVAAKQLLALPGISVCEDVTEVTYYHMLFDHHEIVFSDGAATESLYTGPEALKALDSAARQEILTIFPELADLDYKPSPARPFAIGKRARHLAARHSKNHQHLVA